MIKTYRSSLIFCLILTTIFTFSCKKNKTENSLAVIVNTSVGNISHTKATITSQITSDGGTAITERGVCYSKNASPTISDSKVKSDSTNIGTFVVALSSLETNTKYYVRGYATNTVGTAYGNEVSFTTETIKLGDKYAGGVVFYLDGSGLHGLISSEEGLGNSGKWGCPGTTVPGTGTAIGTGQANTTAIVNACSTPDIAARVCNDLVYNGYSDWFLPSRDELAEMYKFRVQIGFNTNDRWSSSESDTNNSWAQSFDPVAPGTKLLDKNTVHGVRAIRAF